MIKFYLNLTSLLVKPPFVRESFNSLALESIIEFSMDICSA